MTDLRDAFRALRGTPVVSAVAILSLALGIGANTAIFSIVNSLMLRTLPVQEPQQLVQVMTGPTADLVQQSAVGSAARTAGPGIRRRRSRIRRRASTSRAAAKLRLVNGVMASGRFFEVLGVPAILGRTFTRTRKTRPEDGGPPVAVISYAFWQRQYGGAADVIGKTIELDRVPFTIIGVTPPEFTGVDQGSAYDVAIPLANEPLIRGAGESAMDQRTWWWMRVMARLKPGDTIERATTALRGVQPQLREATHARPTTGRRICPTT